MNLEEDIQTQFRACFKSTDDIWSEIDHKDQQNPHPQDVHQDPCQSRHAFGEMTWEDSLVKLAGSCSRSFFLLSLNETNSLCSANNNISMRRQRRMIENRECPLLLYISRPRKPG
ncbi:hypothetical protein Csa_020740 [Cucumis sativus]|uniref:Uncharacterized protein n=1 Tax=Cucumis sativus TaxID=3659 RepID=A0A0A0KB58_CUCSA|nr:hypothetical protein Csa_020740 [Cucumis sativus]